MSKFPLILAKSFAAVGLDNQTLFNFHGFPKIQVTVFIEYIDVTLIELAISYRSVT